MSEKRPLTLPRTAETTESIELTQSVLLIGANGSGKTRLGTWIEMESPQLVLVHRISAQKSLTMPDSTTPISIELAEKNLLFGNEQWTYLNKPNKWQNKPATTLLNDFQKVMAYLFSDETEANALFKVAHKASTTRIDPPETKIDLVKKVWEKIIPHRELVIGGLRIQTRIKGQIEKNYNSSEMSDGERVIFYLIGQCLVAPKNGIIVIDEPELHLHKSVQAPLWAEIERLRNDCLFVYLTHDVDFAAAQEGAQRIWLKSYDGANWDWELVQNDNELPNELLIELLGSRKPVVFVEGENGSHDVSLYRLIMPNFLVLPRGSCSQVIQSVKALRANAQLHHLTVYGLIDRDRRPQVEIDSLERDNIFCLDVAEVENLFCTREILSIVSTQLVRDPDQDLSKVVQFVFKQLQSELDTQVSLRVVAEIKHQLNFFNASAKGEAALTSALQSLHQSIDVAALYSRFDTEFRSIIATKDYDALLKVYNRKSLASQACAALGLKQGELTEMVIRLARSSRSDAISAAVKEYLGKFSTIVT